MLFPTRNYFQVKLNITVQCYENLQKFNFCLSSTCNLVLNTCILDTQLSSFAIHERLLF